MAMRQIWLPLYPLVYAISASMARIYRAVWRAGPDLCAICCRNRTMLRRGGIKARDYVRMGFLCRMGVLNQWLTEEESLWLQSRIYARAYYFYDGWTQYFAAYSLGRLYWQAEGDAMQAYFAHLKYDASGARMFNELTSTTESYYAQLPWRPLNEQPTCPETLKGVSDL